MLNDTLRLELRPLGIEVLHIVTGGISTKFYNNSTGQKLPENSLYTPIAADIGKALAGHTAKGLQTMTPETYAEKVVSNALSSWPTTTMWIGGQTLIGWMGDKFGWDSIRDFIVGYLLGMTSLTKKYNETRRPKQS
jgi:1-acylglycerone phosphate reductase